MRSCILCLLLLLGLSHFSTAQFMGHHLIAHRGGVVNNELEENSIPSLLAAIKRGYYMVELDVRMTKDSILVTHHDRNLKRYFGADVLVEDLTWQELQHYVSAKDNRIQRLDSLLTICAASQVQVMIDLKVRGFHPQVFKQLVDRLEELNLREKALIIPSEEATDFFRSKIKLSCTKEQILAYQKRADYAPSHYFLFANPSIPDVLWAKRNKIQVVGVINEHNATENAYKEIAADLKKKKVEYIQLDSRFDIYFQDEHESL